MQGIPNIFKATSKSYTQLEKEQHLLQWKASGLSMSKYCEQASLSVSSLSKWNSNTKSQQIKFHAVKNQVETPAKQPLAQTTNRLEITLSRNITIRLTNANDLLILTPLLKELIS